jgi:hypothetical protein
LNAVANLLDALGWSDEARSVMADRAALLDDHDDRRGVMPDLP